MSQYSGPIAMHEPYRSDDISCKNTFSVKKLKVESPGSECMNRLVTTTSDIRIRPRSLAY